MTHVYMGTSGWVSTVTDQNIVDTNAMIASVVGVQPGLYNYFAELETAGKCLEWVRDHLALDEINIYLSKQHVADDPSSEYKSLYDYMSKVISETPAGSGGVIFTPPGFTATAVLLKMRTRAESSLILDWKRERPN